MSRVILEDPPVARILVVTDPPHVIVPEPDEDGQRDVIVAAATSTTVVTALETSSRVITTEPPPTQQVIALEPPGTVVVYADPDLNPVIQPVTLQHVVISSPDETGTMLVAVSNRGPKGDPGDVTVANVGAQWIQGLPASVWEITTGLSFQPAGIIVFGDDGYQYEGFLVQYNGLDVRLTFDIALAGVAWLS